MLSKHLPAAGIVALLLLFLLPAAAQADEVTFNLNTLNGAAGTTATIEGTITNSGSLTSFLNGIDVVGLPGGLAVDFAPFFDNAPLSLDGSMSYTGPLFSVVIDPLLAPGFYSGTFILFGGRDEFTFDLLASVDFSFVVLSSQSSPNAVPEPATMLLLGTGLAGVAIRIHKRRQR
ncbi:MAG: PEP-CTERM sorting domain-containing protein [Pyrinomonadaceae bacterium]